MLFYFGIFVALCLLRFALQSKPGLRRKLYPWLLLALFIFVAFRFEVGCDWSGYFFQFQAQTYSSFDDALNDREPLWWVIIEGVLQLGLSYPWLNVAAAAIFFFGVHVLARRQPDPLGFLVLLYPVLIINMPMSGIRQAAAVGVLCVAFAAFLDKRLLRFLLLVVLASTLHNSAIIFLLLAPLVQGEYSKGRLALAVLLAIPGGLAMLGGDAAQMAAERYIGTRVDAFGAAYRVGMLLLSGVAYFWLLRSKWLASFPGDYKLVTIGALVMLSMAVFLPVSTVIGDRLAYYLVPIQAMIFARIPYLPIRKSRGLYAAAPYLVLGLMLLIWSMMSRHFEICYVPYDSWLFGLPQTGMFRYY